MTDAADPAVALRARLVAPVDAFDGKVIRLTSRAVLVSRDEPGVTFSAI